eukprot:TRINITY_DN8434_c0_g1_i8.p1 TRINITY_DN8434_c0_g1~~TRINITY_DN8434_c0_g1_i8.p1  ORF type:complete len:161 (+),score=15.51 TRINITY_DN8434_c0_g1_i8:248-730(+)
MVFVLLCVLTTIEGVLPRGLSKTSTTIDSSEHILRDQNSEEDLSQLVILERSPLTMLQTDWNSILEDPNIKETMSETALFRALRHGYPRELRSRIWNFLANVEVVSSSYATDIYAKLSTYPSEYDLIIKKDVDRSFSTQFVSADIPNFKSPLFNVLRDKE